MKKIFYTLGAVIGLTLMSNNAMAQFEEGQSDINVGVGFVSNLTGGGMPISVSYDYGINDNISIGGLFSYVSASEELGFFGDNYKWNYTYMIIGVRGLYHYELIDGFDTYGGLMLGYNVASVSFEGDPDLEALLGEPTVGGLAYGGVLGGRYHFTDNIGAFLELGYGISVVNVGVTFKF